MYCSNCGTKNEGNKYCTKCGLLLDNSNVLVKKEEKNGLKITSIVFGVIGILGSITVFFSPLSLIISLIGLILGVVATKKVKNVLGIVLNTIGLFLSIIILFLVGLFILLFATDDYGYSDENDYYDRYYDRFDDYFDGNKYGEYY